MGIRFNKEGKEGRFGGVLNSIAVPQEPSFINTFSKGSWKVLLFFSFFQLFFFHNAANLFAVAIVLLNWLVLTKFLLRPINFSYYPLSTFLILGFCLTQFYFPLVFTLIEGKPVVYNLIRPFDVFVHLILVFFVSIIAHAAYTMYLGKPGLRKQSILRHFGLFSPRTEKQIWLIGFIGLSAVMFTRLFAAASANVILNKFVMGFMPFMYAPFLIPLSPLFGVKYSKSKTLTIQLIVYTIAVFVLGIIGNSRGALVSGLTALGFSYFLGMLMGAVHFKIITFRNVMIGAFAIWFITGPLSDLSIAMLVVRGTRTEISSTELLNQTLETYKDKETLKKYKAETSKSETSDIWDEGYLDNIFLARFCNLKFNDNSIDGALRISDENRAVFQNIQIDRLLSILPTPLLRVFNINVNKEWVIASSLGDQLFSFTDGDENSIGGFRTGSFEGTGFAAFGWWYLLIFGVGMVPVFFLFDKLFIRIKIPAASPEQSPHFESRISLCALLVINTIFQFLTMEGTLEIYSYLLRGWIQTVLLYLLVCRLSRIFSTL